MRSVLVRCWVLWVMGWSKEADCLFSLVTSRWNSITVRLCPQVRYNSSRAQLCQGTRVVLALITFFLHHRHLASPSLCLYSALHNILLQSTLPQSSTITVLLLQSRVRDYEGPKVSETTYRSYLGSSLPHISERVVRSCPVALTNV